MRHYKNKRPSKIEVLPKKATQKIQYQPDWKVILQILATLCGGLLGYIFEKGSGVVLGAVFGLLLGKMGSFFIRRSKKTSKKRK